MSTFLYLNLSLHIILEIRIDFFHQIYHNSVYSDKIPFSVILYNKITHLLCFRVNYPYQFCNYNIILKMLQLHHKVLTFYISVFINLYCDFNCFFFIFLRSIPIFEISILHLLLRRFDFIFPHYSGLLIVSILLYYILN